VVIALWGACGASENDEEDYGGRILLLADFKLGVDLLRKDTQHAEPFNTLRHAAELEQKTLLPFLSRVSVDRAQRNWSRGGALSDALSLIRTKPILFDLAEVIGIR